MKALLPLASLLLAVAQADPLGGCRVELTLNLSDGSRIRATPLTSSLKVEQRIAGALALDWQTIKRVDMATAAQETAIHFNNGDRLSASVVARKLEFESLLGCLEIPVSVIRTVEVSLVGDPMINVALGKPVHGRDGASHGKGLAKHVTDGNPATHAKPPASSFDYRIDLQDGEDVSFSIDRMVINWGRFGDRFMGVRQKGGEGWANAAWPGEYVTSYVIECRKYNSPQWEVVHEYGGRPVDEKGGRVEVVKQASKAAGCRWESVTILSGLQLEGVVELRIRAKGGHWIGLFELEAHGQQE